MNIDGDVEMDAVIMDGSDLNCGAVACIQNVENPVSIARLVMEKVYSPTYSLYDVYSYSCTVVYKTCQKSYYLILSEQLDEVLNVTYISIKRRMFYKCQNDYLTFSPCWFQTDHTMLVGKGANKFAEEMRIPSVPTKQLVTDEAVKEWEQYHKFKLSVDTFFKQRYIR